MSWQPWAAAASGVVPGISPLTSVVNPAPAVLPTGSQYTPEQWAQMQQQNWQQWAQWQQQYQQWHQQYGAEYQKSLSALSQASTGYVPPVPNTSVPPPLPNNDAIAKPPLPPEEPPKDLFTSNKNSNARSVWSEPSYNTSSPSTPNAYSTAPPSIRNQPPPNIRPNKGDFGYNTQNNRSGNRSQYNDGPRNQNRHENFGEKRSIPPTNFKSPKKPKFDESPPQTQPAAAASNEDMSETEKRFVKQFTEWEAQFNKWKDQNMNHPDKEQYREYEKKWEAWRTQLLERREQMRRKRLGIADPKQKEVPQVPLSATLPPPLTKDLDTTKPPPFLSKDPIPDLKESFPNSPNPTTPKDPHFEEFALEEQEGDSDPFLKLSKNEGIPGLDLVKDSEGEDEGEKEDDLIDLERENEPREDQNKEQDRKLPDYEAISKGIDNILGDQKLLNMLSMVSQNNQSNQIATASVDTTSKIQGFQGGFGNVNEPPVAQGGDIWANQDQQDQYNDNGSNYDEHSRSSFGGRGNFDWRDRHGNQIDEYDQEYSNEEFNRDYDRGGPFRGPHNKDANFHEEDNFRTNNFRGSDNFRNSGNFNKPDNFGGPAMARNANLRGDGFVEGPRRPPVFEPPPGNNFGGRFEPPRQNFDQDVNTYENTARRPPELMRNAPNFQKNEPRKNRFNKKGNRIEPENFNDNFDQNNFRGDVPPFAPPNNFQSNQQGGNFRKGEFQPPQFQGNFESNAPPGRGPNKFEGNFDAQNRGGSGDFNRRPNFKEERGNFGENRNGGFQHKNNDWFTPPENEFNEDEDIHQGPAIHQDPPIRQGPPIHQGPPINQGPPTQQNFNTKSNAQSNEHFDGMENAGNHVDDALENKELPLWQPAKVIEYEHKSPKADDVEVSIEPLRTFDYRHKSVNRIPFPHRPLWLQNFLKKYPEFAFVLPRTYDQPYRRYPERYDRFPEGGERYDRFPEGGERYDRFPEGGERYDRFPEDGKRYDRFTDGGERHDRFKDGGERYDRFSEDGERYDNRRNNRDIPGTRRTVEERTHRVRDDNGPGIGRRSPPPRHSKNNDRNKDRDYERRFEKDSDRKSEEVLEIKDDFREKKFDSFKSKSSNPATIHVDQYKPEPEKITSPVPQNKARNVILIQDVLNPPGRYNRPARIVIILRGPPGSGKTFLAKLIKDKEVENGGSAPRILSLDDYFMVEQEKEVEVDGKRTKVKEMVYEYEECMENVYRVSLFKAFKKTVTDGYFPFIVVDNVNDKVKYFGEMWSFAKQNGFQVYICQLEFDLNTCTKRNIHNRSESDIQKLISGWEQTPSHHPMIDATSLIQSGSIPEVEMEEITSPPSEDFEMEDAEDRLCRSKWDNFDCSIDNLAKLDGTNKPLRPSKTMEDYLQCDDEYITRECKPGQKRVRWADLEERKEQEKMRAIGFVVGQTNWDRMMDPTMGSGALTQTKYIERANMGSRFHFN